MSFNIGELFKADEVVFKFQEIQSDISMSVKEIKTYWSRDYLDVKSYLTYAERIAHTPLDKENSGHWEGERGESKYILEDPKLKKILEKYGVDGIEYKNGRPDFHPITEATVYNPDENAFIPQNFSYADQKCAKQWNECARDGKTDWTERDVKSFRSEQKYTWHECSDMKTYQLVKREVHEEFKHTGGVAEYKHKNNIVGGFDHE